MFSSFIVPEDRSCLSFGFRLLYSVPVIPERRSNGGRGDPILEEERHYHVNPHTCRNIIATCRKDETKSLLFFFLKPRFHRSPLSSRSFKPAILRKNFVVSSLFLSLSLSLSLSHGIGCKSFFGDIIIFWRV